MKVLVSSIPVINEGYQGDTPPCIFEIELKGHDSLDVEPKHGYITSMTNIEWRTIDEWQDSNQVPEPRARATNFVRTGVFNCRDTKSDDNYAATQIQTCSQVT